jgi:hypothetical protein
MLLRLALVGMVAALGVTFPSPAKYGMWFESAQDWASAVLADWDTWKPRDSSGNSAPDTGEATECPQCQHALAQLAAIEQDPAADSHRSSVETVDYALLPAANVQDPLRSAWPSRSQYLEAAATEPLPLECDLLLAADSKLNAPAGRTEIPATMAAIPTLAAVAPASTPPGPASANSADPTAAPLGAIASSDNVDMSVLEELCRAALDGPRPAPSELVAAREPGQADLAETDSFICGAGEIDELLAVGPARSQRVTQIAPVDEAVGYLTAREIDLDFCSGTPFLCGRGLEIAATPPSDSSRVGESPGRGSVRADATTALADLPRDLFGPAPVVTLAELPQAVFGPPSGLAASGGLNPSSALALADLPRNVFGPRDASLQASNNVALPSSGALGGGRLAGPRLGHAVELTRAAWYAWMNVLTGPALVDVTSR